MDAKTLAYHFIHLIFMLQNKIIKRKFAHQFHDSYQMLPGGYYSSLKSEIDKTEKYKRRLELLPVLVVIPT